MMPHRGRRRDARKEWMLVALRVLFEDLERDEVPVGLVIMTVDSAGILLVHSLNHGHSVAHKSVVIDPEAFTKAAEDNTINLGEWMENG